MRPRLTVRVLRGIGLALQHHNADMEGENVPAAERADHALAVAWHRAQCEKRGWEKVYPHLKNHCPDAPDGKHIYSPDQEYAQKHHLAEGPISCEYCGDSSPPQEAPD